jgi:carbon storage regulator
VLILSRRHGEAIVIEGGIRIIVLSSDRRGARLGIEAPQTVHIRREELPPGSGGAPSDAGRDHGGAEWREGTREKPPR